MQLLVTLILAFCKWSNKINKNRISVVASTAMARQKFNTPQNIYYILVPFGEKNCILLYIQLYSPIGSNIKQQTT